jgi:methionyl-tRNA synthetase
VALNTVLELAKAANKYIENTKPWTLFAKKNTGAINNFLFYLTNAARTITVLLTPVLTNGTKQFIDQLCFTASQLTFADLLDFTKIDGHCVAKTSTPIYNRL